MGKCGHWIGEMIISFLCLTELKAGGTAGDHAITCEPHAECLYEN